MKKKSLGIILVLFILALSSFITYGNSFSDKEKPFEELINMHNITVTGTTGIMTEKEIRDLLCDEENLFTKFMNTSDEQEAIILSPIQLLELQYYTEDLESQHAFWLEAKDCEVKVKLVRNNQQMCIFSFYSSDE